MLGKINYVTNSINNQPWKHGLSGFAFEDKISDFVSYVLREYYSKGLTIEQTPRTRDNGKDLVINSPVTFSLLGKTFRLPPGRSTMCVYLEIKSSLSSTISLGHFSKNLLLANGASIDYFVLITDQTIAPFSYYLANQNAEENGYHFYLVDQYALAHFFMAEGAIFGGYVAPDSPAEVSISYQIDYQKQAAKPYLELYLLFQNNTPKPQVCRFQLRSDRNWQLSETKFQVFLEAYATHCKRIGVQKEFFDGCSDIMIELSFNDELKNVVITGDAIDYEFEPPLVGEARKSLISELSAEIQDNTGFKLVHIQGEAGIGKTRILHEMSRILCNTGIDWVTHICSNSNPDDSNAAGLSRLLRKRLQTDQILRLSDLFAFPMCFKRFVVAIEDIHNADKDLFDEVKGLTCAQPPNNPITIIVVGRDDDTVYNQDYFSFLSWLRDVKDDRIVSHAITPLSDNECRNMIRAIIRGVPDVVMKRIHTASRNNPFYVCQYIEYLLETKLIFLINRNTVGIANVTSFSQKLYVPESIEALLNERFAHLLALPSGRELQDYLLLLCFYGIEIPQEVFYSFSSHVSAADASVLYARHFLRLTNENNITFDHESIFLFLKRRLDDAQIMARLADIVLSIPGLLELYPFLRRVYVQYYAGQVKEAEAMLEPAINEIRSIKNVSSCNLSAQYMDAYTIIYELARKNEDTDLQKSTILAQLYVALHHYAAPRGAVEMDRIIRTIKKDHSHDTSLKLTAQQLYAHSLMRSSQISMAKKQLLELAAQERANRSQFTDETRFDLFDRLSSIYIQENHREVAVLYNQLSAEIAQTMNDPKLLTLSKILKAKIHFYSDTTYALRLMREADSLLRKDASPRIDLHNQFGMLTADLLLHFNELKTLSELQKSAEALLQRGIDNGYASETIRGHYLLAVLSYLTTASDNKLGDAKLHLDAGIGDCIRNGMAKMLPQFYCLYGIIAVRQKVPEKMAYEYFETMLLHMRQCGQLFIGARDFLYSNIILLTNYAISLKEYRLESELYQFLSEIKYYGSDVACDFKCSPSRECYYTCSHNMDVFRANYQTIAKGGLLFLPKQIRYPLRDSNTPFYISLGV